LLRPVPFAPFMGSRDADVQVASPTDHDSASAAPSTARPRIQLGDGGIEHGRQVVAMPAAVRVAPGQLERPATGDLPVQHRPHNRRQQDSDERRARGIWRQRALCGRARSGREGRNFADGSAPVRYWRLSISMLYVWSQLRRSPIRLAIWNGFVNSLSPGVHDFW